jgi:hypothetical protein
MSMQNPTILAASQFIKPFDILPNIIMLSDNPTSRFTQFAKKPYDILPNKNYNKVSAIPKLPISAPEQFDADVDPTVNWNPDTTVNIYGINNYTKDSAGYIATGSSAIWQPNGASNTNITIQTAAAKAFAFGASALGGFTGIPFVTQVGQSLTGEFGNDNLSGEFTTLQKDNLFNIPGIKYADFRSRKLPGLNASNLGQQTLASLSSIRVDGLAASFRSKGISQLYAKTSASPIGAYSVFNLESWFGWGEHDNPNAVRSDFTLRSHITTRWKKGVAVPGVDDAGNGTISKVKDGEFAPTLNPQELATPFRGDKVSVIDFGKRKLKDAYQWKPKRKISVAGLELPGTFDITQDFIKFYFTGPKLHAGNEDDEDDIIVFRAAITSFSENFNPGWTDVKMIGRADPNYTYTGFTRDVSLEFDIYATDRDELKPIYRKLNALAGYTAPTYDAESIAMIAPWMRLTIGDLYVNTPVVMTSLGYTYAMDASWEINIERDLQMMQVPKKISVSCGFNVITDYLPQNGGRFWTLAKRFEKDATPLAGNDNWLSDSVGNLDQEKIKYKRVRKGKVKGDKVSKDTNVNTESTDQFKFQPPNVLESDGDVAPPN